MNYELLQLKGLISMLSEEDQTRVKVCIGAIEEVLNRYPEEIKVLAFTHIGLEMQGKL